MIYAKLDVARSRFEEALNLLGRDLLEHGRASWGLGKLFLQERPPDRDKALKCFEDARADFLGSNPREWIGVTKDMISALEVEDPRKALDFALHLERYARAGKLDHERDEAVKIIAK